MFRDSEIIDLIKALTKQVSYLSSKDEGDVFQKLADIEDHCQDLSMKLDAIDENCLRDDEEFRFQIKEAMREFNQLKLEEKVLKPKKTVCKKRVGKK